MSGQLTYDILGYHSTEVRVPFGYIDSYGYLWHGHALNFFEIARADMVRPFGLSAKNLLEQDLATPILDVQIKYFNPAYDDEVLHIITTLKKPSLPLPHLHFDYQIVSRSKNTVILRGETKQVLVKASTLKILIHVPGPIRQRLNALWDYLATDEKAAYNPC